MEMKNNGSDSTLPPLQEPGILNITFILQKLPFTRFDSWIFSNICYKFYISFNNIYRWNKTFKTGEKNKYRSGARILDTSEISSKSPRGKLINAKGFS